MRSILRSERRTHADLPTPSLGVEATFAWVAVALGLLLAALALGVVWLQQRGDATLRAGEPARGFAAAHARGRLIVGLPPRPVAVKGAAARTEDGLDAALAEALGQRLGLPVETRADSAGAPAGGDVDVVLAIRPVGADSSRHGWFAERTVPIETGYRTRPQAVMRSDTTLRRWQDLHGRTVCIAQAALPAQREAARWDARVTTFRFPSDALVAVREGRCDLALIDDVSYAPLMRLPEWRKFSASLPRSTALSERVWLLPAGEAAARRDDAAALADTARAWARDGTITRLAGQWSRQVAFDVYLDQSVPDCHG
ncbi:type 2 periplasmic-binding domain-containing protein [Chitinasiproducens palmae]|uniref:Polar amino acid transport system substrate-binding protein n=1 Tax=Chitinasiproducens palmae TaxID=1770053 RepID=A0A1H2PXX5_9BURK|nr:transporter substrate-binding domain-containing protein [Chitinasiproducens palmae]SDV51508.1 polar amino acid transport system substrate-binding protein [Chitinasiproducens palmae]